MGYSNDLRVRVIQVVEGGAAARATARQFVIGNLTAIRWTKRWRETGSFEAKSNKGQLQPCVNRPQSSDGSEHRPPISQPVWALARRCSSFRLIPAPYAGIPSLKGPY
jgi:transposase